MAAGELVNLSLDEIIARQNKFKRFANEQRGRNRFGRGGGTFRNGFRGRQIPAIGSSQRQKFNGQNAQKVFEKLCTVHISNLGPMVTTRDLQELFAEHPYVDIAVHYDQRGNSRGTAVVLFRRFEDAMQLKRQFTGVKLDGHLMELFAMSNRSPPTGSLAGGPGTFMQPMSNYSLSRGRGPKSNGRWRSGNFGGFRVMKKLNVKSPGKRAHMTAEQLDQELDEYMRSAKHTRVEAP